MFFLTALAGSISIGASANGRSDSGGRDVDRGSEHRTEAEPGLPAPLPETPADAGVPSVESSGVDLTPDPIVADFEAFTAARAAASPTGSLSETHLEKVAAWHRHREMTGAGISASLGDRQAPFGGSERELDAIFAESRAPQDALGRQPNAQDYADAFAALAYVNPGVAEQLTGGLRRALSRFGGALPAGAAPIAEALRLSPRASLVLATPEFRGSTPSLILPGSLPHEHLPPEPGMPTIGLLHGLGRDLHFWDAHVAMLRRQGYGIWRPNLHDFPTNRADALAAEVARQAAQYGVEILAGHSYGGAIALMAAGMPDLAGRLRRVDAWMTYVENPGIRNATALANLGGGMVDAMWAMNPFHWMMMWNPFYAMAWTGGRAMFNSGLHMLGQGMTQTIGNSMGRQYLAMTRGPQAAYGAAGLPDSLLYHNTPRIPPTTEVRLLKGPDSGSSMMPHDVPMFVDPERYAYDLLRALQWAGNPNVHILRIPGADHMYPEWDPVGFVATTTAGLSQRSARE